MSNGDNSFFRSETRQTALFSATMPSVIKRIAQTYLNKPAEVTIAAKTGTADNIRQRLDTPLEQRDRVAAQAALMQFARTRVDLPGDPRGGRAADGA